MRTAPCVEPRSVWGSRGVTGGVGWNGRTRRGQRGRGTGRSGSPRVGREAAGRGGRPAPKAGGRVNPAENVYLLLPSPPAPVACAALALGYVFQVGIKRGLELGQG